MVKACAKFHAMGLAFIDEFQRAYINERMNKQTNKLE